MFDLFQVKSILTPRKTAATVVCIFVTCTFGSTPVYIVNRLEWQFSSLRNKTFLGLVFADDKEDVEMLTFLINNFIIPFGSFVIVAACTVVLSTQLSKMSKWRKTTISSEQADGISSRNLKVAQMVVKISILFIICFIPSTMLMAAVAFEPALTVKGKYVHVSQILGEFNYVLEGINASMNIIIYHHMCSKYRYTFKKLFIVDKN